ncbi:tyrosine-type recombinase/integrase [Castellaniella hirudinis]|uniref:tyrosine-type recombinase/integrase n=1 Tax=Castellaniella hirudinis TaxID=1144617 RepID=UPI0039C226E4
MGIKKQIEGVRAREASILIDFRWGKNRFRERVELAPTVANLRVAQRMRNEILAAIAIDKFDWDDFSRYFPNSCSLPKGSDTELLPTFRDVAQTWIKLIAPNVASTTLKEYINALNRYFYPIFQDKPIAHIEYEDFAVYIASLPIKSAKTFNNVMTPVRGVFALAQKTGKVSRDITRDIPSRKGQKASPDPLNLEEVELVLHHVSSRYGDQWLNYFEFAFFSGCRPSEIIALQWPSMDLRREQVRIERARVRATDKDTKTHSARDIDLQSRALQAIARQKAHTFLAGAHVFLNPTTGERFTDTSAPLDIVWRPTLKALGIRHRDARQTRHTFATMCLTAGMNPAYVSRQMGHTNPRMFFEVYSKWIDGEASDREKAKMDALFTPQNRVKTAS